jgi:hypothetical protein
MLLLHFFAVQNPLKYYQWLATKRSTHVLARLFKSGKGMDGNDRPLRFLDCAVIKHLHEIVEAEPRAGGVQPFDTVRGLFVEGERAYPGSAFRAKSHVQIAVRNADCIKGLFYPIGPEAATVMAQP